MLLKVNIFLGKTNFLDGAGDSFSFNVNHQLSFSSWKFIYFLQHSKALRRIAYHLFLPHWFISLTRCQHTSGNWNLHPSIYWQSVFFKSVKSLLSLSLVWCQQTAGKFKYVIIDLLTTDIFLESFFANVDSKCSDCFLCRNLSRTSGIWNFSISKDWIIRIENQYHAFVSKHLFY